MLAIKLSRVGKKKQPSYRVVVTEKARDPWGKNNEIVGFYNPLSNPKEIRFEEERVKYWISQGAQPTDTVHNLLVNAGVIEGDKRKAHPTHTLSAEELAELEAKKKKEAEAAQRAQTAAEEAKTAAEAPVEESKPAPATEPEAEEAPAEEKKEEAPAEEPKTE
jgi:small subunit ribosomal protein S16